MSQRKSANPISPSTTLFALITWLAFGSLVQAASWSWGYRKKITINDTKVSGTSALSNFPVLVSLVDPDLRTTADGGNVQSLNGHDIGFRASDGTTRLAFEVETYTSDAVNGTLIAWVKIPSVSHDTPTDFYIYYGNSNISCPQERPSWVWDSNYKGVWHLTESSAGASGEFIDSTENNNDAQGGGGNVALLPNLVGAQIGDGQNFDGDLVDDHIMIPNSMALEDIQEGDYTVEAWFYPDVTPPGAGSDNDAHYGIVMKQGNHEGIHSLNSDQFEMLHYLWDDSNVFAQSPSFPPANDYHVVGTVSRTNGEVKIYVNGAWQDTATFTPGTAGRDYGVLPWRIGIANPGAPTWAWPANGKIDEVRFSDVVRSADWIQTGYNNQNSPATFYSVGGQEPGPWNFPWGYGYRKKLTIDQTKVTCTSNLTDYPMLVNLVDPDLRTTADGGHVEHPLGYDFAFRESDGVSNLAFEIEQYDSDAVNGSLTAWVKIPDLPYDTNTDIYMYYGNPEVACLDQTSDPAGVWDANYVGVWHLNQDPSGTVFDSTGYGHHAVSEGSMDTSNLQSGQIGDALFFDGQADDYLKVNSTAALQAFPRWTLEMWVNRWFSQWVYAYAIAISKTSWPSASYALSLNPTGAPTPGYVAVSSYQPADGVGTSADITPSCSSGLCGWVHAVGTFDPGGTGYEIFVDGVSSNTKPQADGSDYNGEPLFFGRDNAAATTTCFHGVLDEIRISNVIRPSCWIQTEYNNTSSPPTFYTVGPEEPGPPTLVSLSSLTATGHDAQVLLEWQTGSEVDNLGFHIHRASSPEGPYARITTSLVPGLGSSPEGASYRYLDEGLTNGVRYLYKLEDIESTGRTRLHGPVSAKPQADAGTCCRSPGGEGPEGSLITVGQPADHHLRVLETSRDAVVLELTTGGFSASPQPDGTVRISVPGYEQTSDVGSPALPVRRSWVEAVAGRKVKLVSVEAREEETFTHLRPAAAGKTELEASLRGTVRASRRRSRKPGPVPVAYPKEWARVLDVGFQGKVKKALVELAPLRWDPASGGMVFSRRLVVRLAFAGRDRGDLQRGGLDGHAARRRASHRSSRVAARLVTRDKGLYGTSFESIFGRRHRAVRRESLRLSRQGETIPFQLVPDGGSFGPGSTLYFVSEGATANPYAVEGVYELEVGTKGERMRFGSAVPGGETNNYSWYRLEQEQNRLYQAALLDAPDRWLWSMLLAPHRKSFPFTVSALASGADPFQLRVWLQGVSDLDADPDHHLRLYVNGTLVGETSWNGRKQRVMVGELGPGVLHEGENHLEIENVGDTEASSSMVMLDRFALSYPRLPQAIGGLFEGSFSESGTVEVQGLGPGAFVLELGPTGPGWLVGAEATASGIQFQVDTGPTYLAVSPQAVGTPEVRRPLPARLKTRRNGAEYLMIGPRAFVEAAGELLRRRQAQGLRSKGVALEQVYSEFGFGEPTPHSIRDFLAYAYHYWQVAPRYVVLLGDATYDYKNFLKTDVANRVPPLMIETSYLWTASDPAYASVNGHDLLPDLAIGRLPAATVKELEAMVDKIVAWEISGQTLTERAVLVSDDPDAGGHFVHDAESLAATVLSSQEIVKVYVSELGAPGTRIAIRDAFDRGASLANYIGHGGIHLWADENIFDIHDVASLAPQSEQPMLLTMNCLNGYFHFPYFNSLAEELVKVEDKGAIAAFSPSGLSLNGPAHLYHRSILAELLHGQHERLGDAVLAAQEVYAETGAFPELLAIYHLLGDRL